MTLFPYTTLFRSRARSRLSAVGRFLPLEPPRHHLLAPFSNPTHQEAVAVLDGARDGLSHRHRPRRPTASATDVAATTLDHPAAREPADEFPHCNSPTLVTENMNKFFTFASHLHHSIPHQNYLT